MSQSLIRASGIACIIGGASLAAFMLIHPWDQLMGAAIAQTPRWQLAHTFHFVGALFAVAGLIGIYLYQRERLGPAGLIGFALSFAGTAMFAGTGMITAFIWPMLAMDAPSTVDVGGAIFGTPRSAFAFGLTAVTTSVGYVVFGAAMLRTNAYPRLAVVALVVGAVIGMLPPHPVGPVPWAISVFGGVLYGVALISFGVILTKAASAKTAAT